MEKVCIVCSHCKTELKFCAACGKELEWSDIEEPKEKEEEESLENICPQCKSEVMEGANFCRCCGAKLAAEVQDIRKTCRKCGAELLQEANFCIECGQKIN